MLEHNAKLEFIDAVNQIIHEATSIFYFYRSDYPIDDQFIQDNIELSGTLFDVYHGHEVTEQVKDPNALAIAKCHKKDVIHVYTHAINERIECSAQNKGKRPFLLLPDLDSLSYQIEELLEDVVKDGYKRKKVFGISSFIHP